jgi:hypothetical protein
MVSLEKRACVGPPRIFPGLLCAQSAHRFNGPPVGVVLLSLFRSRGAF